MIQPEEKAEDSTEVKTDELEPYLEGLSLPVVQEAKYVDDLYKERGLVDRSLTHTHRLLQTEIDKCETGLPLVNGFGGYVGTSRCLMTNKPPVKRSGEFVSEAIIRLSEKIFVPCAEYPKFNFIGKLLGPKGLTLKRLQSITGCKMAILGRGSMRGGDEEEKAKQSGDPKYAHLHDPLHVLVEVEGTQCDAHARIAMGIAELKKYLVPAKDEINEDQLREMAMIKTGLDGTLGIPNPAALGMMIPGVGPRARALKRPAGITIAGLSRGIGSVHGARPSGMYANPGILGVGGAMIPGLRPGTPACAAYPGTAIMQQATGEYASISTEMLQGYENAGIDMSSVEGEFMGFIEIPGGATAYDCSQMGLQGQVQMVQTAQGQVQYVQPMTGMPVYAPQR